MKKRLLALLLSTGLIATTSAGVLAADFSTVPEMTVILKMRCIPVSTRRRGS